MDYERLRATWEALCRDHPERAEKIGPPNWLVKERVKKNEKFLDAAVRVKAEDLVKSREGRKNV